MNVAFIMPVPYSPKIYHIVHVDRLPSIINDGYLWCDAEISRRYPQGVGTNIGMENIKRGRMGKSLNSHSDLHVGDCVPFYFSPRSVMLYVIYMGNHPGLNYRGGQEPIVHLEADLHQVVKRADANNRRWVFTSSNAASSTFEDYADLSQLDKLDWDAIRATEWKEHQDGKQAEFLVEYSFPWHLVARVGVRSSKIRDDVTGIIRTQEHRPPVETKQDWYY